MHHYSLFYNLNTSQQHIKIIESGNIDDIQIDLYKIQQKQHIWCLKYIHSHGGLAGIFDVCPHDKCDNATTYLLITTH